MNRISLSPSEIFNEALSSGEVIGQPRLVGKGIEFKGNDGLLLPYNPMPPWEQFSLSVDFMPISAGGGEQRFLHLGHGDGPRFLLETRNKDGNWCLDVYLQSEDGMSLVLMDRERLHPENRWYSVEVDVNESGVAVYVDGTLETEASFSFKPFAGGKMSLGVRQNRVSFFSGTVGGILIERGHHMS